MSAYCSYERIFVRTRRLLTRRTAASRLGAKDGLRGEDKGEEDKEEEGLDVTKESISWIRKKRLIKNRPPVVVGKKLTLRIEG